MPKTLEREQNTQKPIETVLDSLWHAYLTVGSSSDTWGRTWTDTELANGTFRLRLDKNPSVDNLFVDYFRVKVYYTTGGGVSTTTVAYIHTDHLGGSSVITNDHKDIIQVTDYYPYGSIRVNTKEPTAHFDERRKFTGYEHDYSTGLNYAGARYQNALEGRFTGQDPAFVNTSRLNAQLVDPQSWNSYSYARNNPLRLVDPNGAWFKEFFTGKQSWSSFQGELGDASNQLSQDSTAWNFAINHPYASGALVGFGSAAAAVSGVEAYGAFYAATYPGVGAAYAAQQSIAGIIYSYLAGSALTSIPKDLSTLAGPDFSSPSSYSSTIWSLGLNAGSLAGGYIGAFSDITQLSRSFALQVYSNSLSQSFQSSSVQTRFESVNNFNSATGATAPQDKLWVTPGGTVVNWNGDVISSAPEQ